MMRPAGFIHLTLVVALTGCPGEEELPPTADESGGTTGTEPTTTSPPTTTEPTTTTAPTTGETDTDTGETETATDTAEDCLADGCWSCPLEEPQHFLNACTDASCEPFENSQKRLPLIGADGTLPPLP